MPSSTVEELLQHATALRRLARDLVGDSAADDVLQDAAVQARPNGPAGRSGAGCIRKSTDSESVPMFAWLKQRRLRSQLLGLQQQHLRLLEAARDLQRNGDIRGFADKTAEAEAASTQIDGFLAAHPELAEQAAGGSR